MYQVLQWNTKQSIIFLSFLLLCFETIHGGKDQLSDTVHHLRQKILEKGGCKTPAVCFAIDSSASIGKENFMLEKKIVDYAVKVISVDEHVKFAGSHYGVVAELISTLTKDKQSFLTALKHIQYLKDEETSISAPIVHCDSQLSKSNSKKSIGTVVIIGDGRNNFGGSPVRNAKIFNAKGGRLLTVGIGNIDKKNLQVLSDESDDKNPVLKGMNNFSEVLKTIVLNICFPKDK